jgi:dinuclear metal center YbgI/SA1388 family protein
LTREHLVTRLSDIVAFLEKFAPLGLAEEWDNVGLLVGDAGQPMERVMTCLTLSGDVAAEAVSRRADLVVTHHPLLFRPIQRITSETSEGRVLLDLIRAGIAVYSPHTAYDSAAEGINQQLAELLELRDVTALRPLGARTAGEADRQSQVVPPVLAPLGSGRSGRLLQALTLSALIDRVKNVLGIRNLQFVGDERQTIERVALACGSAAEFLPDARRHGCEVLITGEARFHACLDARATGIAMILASHYATERPAVEQLAARIAHRFPDVHCLPSETERDPVQWSVS